MVVLRGGSPESLSMLSERVSNKGCYDFNFSFTQALGDIHWVSGEWTINNRVLVCHWIRLPLLISLCCVMETDCQNSERCNATFRTWWQGHEAKKLLGKGNGKRRGETDMLPRRLCSSVIPRDSHRLYRSSELDRSFPPLTCLSSQRTVLESPENVNS